jgi:hypothetical protein
MKTNLKDRPPITICIGGCEVNRIYKVKSAYGVWFDMRLPDLTEYNVNGVLCPMCQAERDDAFAKEMSRVPITYKQRILRSWEHKGDI